MTIEALYMTVVENDMIAISLLAINHLCHPSWEHGIHMAHITFKVNTVMEGRTLLKGILPKTIPRRNADKIQWKTHIHPLLNQSKKHTVFDIDKDRYILFNGYFMPLRCREEISKIHFRITFF